MGRLLGGLRNRYFACVVEGERCWLDRACLRLRHGFSMANHEGIIVSVFENGRRPEYGLHESGRREAAAAGAAVARAVRDVRQTFIVTSDFSRTVETAELLRKALPGGDGARVYLQPLLRERNFGEFELRSNANYARVRRRFGVVESARRFGSTTRSTRLTRSSAPRA